MFVGLSARFFHATPPPATVGRLSPVATDLAVRRSGSRSAAPAQRAYRSRIATTTRKPAARDGQTAPKSLSKTGLRPLAASRTILSVPVLVVRKERAACQFAVLARPLGPDATAGNPGKGKTLNSPPIGGFSEFSRRAVYLLGRLSRQRVVEPDRRPDG